jgi:phage head maturation protease
MKQRPELVRSVPLVDYEIERGGDGRTVVAYAATFDDPYEVVDFQGHYDEILNRAAFNRTLGRGIGGLQVLYNHGRTLSGTPSAEFSKPVAVAEDVKAEPRGLLTRSRYLKTPLGDEMLEMWRAGAITAQSFRGPIIRSAPSRPGPNGRPVIERLELGLVEYGPAPFAVNSGADLVAIRSALLEDRLSVLGDLSDEERAELAAALTLGKPLDAPADLAPGDEAPADPDPQDDPAPEATVDPASSIHLLEAEAAQRRRRLHQEN